MDREFVTYHNENGTEVDAYVVPQDSPNLSDSGVPAWTVNTVAGPRHPVPGDVVVRTQNSNFYDVMPASTFMNDHQEGAFTGTVDQGDTAEPDEDVEFEPDDHTAAEVRKYLESLDRDSAEYRRVFNAETNGRNRQSAFPKGL